MPLAFIIGGTGQIGLAVAATLARRGWDVRLASRAAPPAKGPWRHVTLDRSVSGALASALGEGADLMMDCISMDAAHAEELRSVQDRVGRIVATSSASVYRDTDGRTLDEARETGFPRFPVPISEDHPTVAPGPQTYSTRKVAMEQTLLSGARIPVTILRPCAIHGPYSKHAREWWFAKRLLDGRQRIPLAYAGRSRFQTTSTKAIANAVVHALKGHAPSVLNVTDADAPTVVEIGRAIMAAMECDAELVGLPDGPCLPSLGTTPWSVEHALVCASSAPAAGTYADTVPEAVQWLLEAMHDRDWRDVLPQLAAYPWELFDYEADDYALSDARAGPIRI
ncbi:reductase [Phyllobacterium phragmitis]|uniref:Reductase n=1 Tax=Phyllobacterium phragmitis TaxID=2670329 RepID=A0A2S9IWK4_9HYPH|nr:NAD-dependent epimerase/dehydratase family protein [Phyllobacterium phragmitis]PRD44916.1 reductase [Phyllobacterium phragmitis]